MSNRIPDVILKGLPHAYILQTDFHGFTEYSGSKVWPSTDPDDHPTSAFQCNRCKYIFYAQIYGFYDPAQNSYEEAKTHIDGHNRVCKVIVDMTSNADIFKRIDNEVAAQIVKFGKQSHHPLYWYAIFGEEVGKALVENDLEGYEQELIQVAATCVSMIQSLHDPDLNWCEPKSLTHSTKRIKK